MCAVKVNLQQIVREVVQIHPAQQRLSVRMEMLFRVTQRLYQMRSVANMNTNKVFRCADEGN